MRKLSPGMLAAGVICLTAFTLVAVGVPSSRKAPLPRFETPDPQPLPSVSAGGFTLVSTTVDLPVEDAAYPAGPHAEIINANCTSCHSASMALTQPVLSVDQWKATVAKMREVYHAPIARSDISAIVAYLTSMPSQKVHATGVAQAPDPKLAPAANRPSPALVTKLPAPCRLPEHVAGSCQLAGS
jgi:hypothetical protein